MLDLATRDFAPVGAKSATEATSALFRFVGPSGYVLSLHCDNAPELKKAAENLGWNADHSIPFLSGSNGVVERANRHVEEGTITWLEEPGLGRERWPLAGRSF